jgi:hypothetical protein
MGVGGVAITKIERRLASPTTERQSEDLANLTESTSLSTSSATFGMVAGTATGRYPSNPASSASDYFDHHESLFGQIPCFRSYESGNYPSSFAATSGVGFGLGSANRWSHVSYKPTYSRYVQSTTPSLNQGYSETRDFLDTVPIDGMIKKFTVHHETDVGDKIPNTIPTQAEAKQLWYVAGKAVQDHGHPEVLFTLVAGSKDTITRSGGLGLQPIFDATWGNLSAAVTTGMLGEVVDCMDWDPYNIASQDDNYALNRQDPAFFFDPIVDWNLQNLPDARFGIAETGYRPNQADLAMRPAWIAAMRDYCIGVDCLTLLYFDTVVALGKQNWLGEYTNPRHDGTTNAYAFPGGTTFPADTATINSWQQIYEDFPAYQATAADLSNIR